MISDADAKLKHWRWFSSISGREGALVLVFACVALWLLRKRLIGSISGLFPFTR